MATLEKKSPVTTSKLLHQQSLPTPKHHHPLQQQLSAPVQHKSTSNNPAESMQVSIEQQSDKSSLNSVELEAFNDCDCDRGFGSMSSTEQAQMRRQNSEKSYQEIQVQHRREIDDLKDEITKLKCDKLDLLRQNVVSNTEHNEIHSGMEIYVIFFIYFIQTCQRDIKRLKEREFLLQNDITTARNEIHKMRELLKELTSTSTDGDL